MQTFFGFSSIPKIVRGTEFLTLNVYYFSAYSLKVRKGLEWEKIIYTYKHDSIGRIFCA